VGSFLVWRLTANEATAETTLPDHSMWAIPGVYKPAGASPADYEMHGNNNLNNGQHVFTHE